MRDRNKKRHHFRIVLCGPILEGYMYMYIQYTHLALDPETAAYSIHMCVYVRLSYYTKCMVCP